MKKTIAIEAIVFVNSAKTIRWRRLIASYGELSTVSYIRYTNFNHYIRKISESSSQNYGGRE